MKIQRSSLIWILAGSLILASCQSGKQEAGGAEEMPFMWENAHIYFLLTDRFLNGDPGNDLNFGRDRETGIMRGYLGGDLAGVIQKLEEGYFRDLGITALWMTPWFEQNHGFTDEGTGLTYAYHGYWTQDWTAMDPNVGRPDELERLVELAHEQGIRVVMDVIINHTGPVTAADPVWPADWVRTSPPCDFQNYKGNIACTLVENLPDILTESDQEVELPPSLLEKWEQEGRLEVELAELDAFFERTGYPRAPRYYIIKWLTDYVRKYGLDGYRLDTAKHIEEGIWKELYDEAALAFALWKKEHPEKVLDNNSFYMVGEVYNYGVSTGRLFDFGDRQVDFYAQDIHSLINFQFKSDAHKSCEELFSSYSDILHGPLRGQGILNYLSSHDDSQPYDAKRERCFEAATKLLLTPGASQLYYGDESARLLVVPGAVGDAHLRSAMNWEEMETGGSRGDLDIQALRAHYSKLGQFRRDHPSVGAGKHRMLSSAPYVFSRVLKTDLVEDAVLVGMDLEPGTKILEVSGLFEDGQELYDYYSGKRVIVNKGKVSLETEADLVLLGASKS